jgi:hypothetical protein
MRRASLMLAAVLWSACGTAPADIVLYKVPGTDLVFVLQGTVSTNPGRTITFRHPRYGSLYLALEDIQKFEVPSTRTIAERKRKKAEQAKNVEACIDAARWALHNGLLSEFREAASAAWRIDKEHATVKRLAAMSQKIKTPLADSPTLEEEMRQFVRGGRNMRFQKSDHFLLLHDTPDDKDRYSRKTRAEERLELLETVFHSFLFKFSLEGHDLEVPQERLKVVLFADKEDFSRFGQLLGPSLSKAAGFYDRKNNVSVFYDQGTDESFEALYALNKQLQEQKRGLVRDRAPGTQDVVRLADTIQLLTEVARENLDIEVVSHEATHHLAGTTGLMPADAPVPVWAAEGLATYFESPKQAAWSGIGSVNKERLNWYKGLEADREHSNIDFIVSDQIFSRAGSHGSTLHAYGQSWALTHFLMAHHFDKLFQWYMLIAAKPAGKPLTDQELVESFDKVFGKDKSALDLEWRKYMRTLKTDLELVLADKD